MNKTELKNFAINSRLELLSRVRDRAALYGITEEKCKTDSTDPAESFMKVDGNLLSNKETEQRKALEERIQNSGFVQVMEEAAYTWFNRFTALRYMEEHNLLPIDMRVIPQKAGDLPQIVREAQNVAIEGIDLPTILQFLDDNKSEELYKYLIITLCNNLSAWLPQMFEKINDYTELLFPDGLLKSDSFLGMLASVGEDNWQDIQVIGWLYQYYNTELKEETFALLKKNVKITKDRIGAATQLFTPKWIVRYMVENSLGRLWYEGHPDDSLKAKWQYYLDEAKQDSEVEEQLKQIREERKKLKPEEIKLLDPCMGSGHILVYAFDVLMQIYRSIGYTDRDAVKSIIENNLYGLDIDDRAAQLAYFALMMKATEYDKRFLKRGIQPNVCAIQESNTLSEFTTLCGQMSLDNVCIETVKQLINTFVDAKEYGSIVTPQIENLSSTHNLIEQLQSAAVKSLEVTAWYEKAKNLLPQMAKQAVVLQQKYDVVVTNPPYMNSSGMNELLLKYVKKNRPKGKADLYATFMDVLSDMTEVNGLFSMIVQHSWMFLPSFQELREKFLQIDLINLLHLGPHTFEEISGEVVQSVAFIYRNSNYIDYKSVFYKLVDYSTAIEKERNVLEKKNYIICYNNMFYELPSCVYAYWATPAVIQAFKQLTTVSDFGDARQGMATGNNEKFTRFWYEIEHSNIGFNCESRNEFRSKEYKYVPYTKSAGLCRWYGNYLTVLKFDDYNYDLLSRSGNCLPSRQYYFRENANWSLISTGRFGARYAYRGSVFDVGAHAFFSKENTLAILGYLNSVVFELFIKFLSPTLNYNSGIVAKVPCIMPPENTGELVINNIQICKSNWDSYETSWDFQSHPLLSHLLLGGWTKLTDKSDEMAEFPNKRRRLSDCYDIWVDECTKQYDQLKANEEELNRVFIDIYGLQDELTPEVADKDVTVRKADLGRDIRSLISYAVGCMFGRYSLDVPGLVYAGGEWDASKYVTYPADQDGILPITDDEYFQDDIVSMFIRWVKVVYGEETLEENLQFIANALNPSGNSAREVIRSYFLNDFFADHLKVYQKKPIYWQFDSGKQNGFKALMYLHRYDQDTVARLRTDYVHELQDRYRTQLDDARKTTETGDARQRSLASKRAQKLDKQLTELNKYEELVHHYADMRISLDLDDGVKVNYAKLKDLLTVFK